MRAKLAIVALGAASVLACSGSTDRAARRYMDRGDEYAANGDYQAATIEFRNAVKLRPSLPDAHLRLARAYAALGRADQAYRAYSDTLDLDHDNIAAFLESGRLLLASGLYDEARTRAEEVLQRDPQDVDAHVLLGSALAKLKRVDDAIAELESASASDQGPSAFAALAAVRESAGDREGAAKAFHAAVARAPREVAPRVALAQFLMSTGHPGEAQEQLLQAVAANPTDELANRAVALLYLVTGRSAQAEPYLRAAAAVAHQQYRSTLALADYYLDAGRAGEAKAALDTVTATTGPLAVAARVRRAALELNTGSPASAHRLLDPILKKTPTAAAWALNAQILASEGHTDLALQSARAALDLNPRLAAAHYAVGAIELGRGRLNDADRELRQAARSPRLRPAATLLLARTKLASGAYAEASDLAEAAGTSRDARLTLARAHAALGESGRARDELQALAAESPGSPDVAIALGELALDRGDAAAARSAFERALALAPDSIDALAGATAADIALDRPADARARLDARLGAGRAADLRVLLLAAQAARAAGDDRGAESSLLKATAADPSSFDAAARLAELYADRGDLDRARGLLEALARRDAAAAAPRTALGVLLQAAGRDNDARSWYEQALAVDPADAVAATNLARLYSADAGDAAATVAVRLGRTAVAGLPASADAHDTLGWAYYKAGRLELALAELQRAAALDAGEPLYRRHVEEVARAVKAKAETDARTHKRL